MKHYAACSFMLLFALVFGSSFAQAGEVGEEPAIHYEIIFDGYCDGVALDVSPANGLVTGVYASVCASCPFTNLMAGSAGDLLGPLGLTANLGWDTFGDAGEINLFTRIYANGTWEHYNFDGSVFNSGTWSLCPAGVVDTPNAVPSTAPADFEIE